MRNISKEWPIATFNVLNPDGTTITVPGRQRWALEELIRAGKHGCTPIDNPAPRWSGYVRSLREHCIQIETIHASHGGDFPGSHARYVLRSQVTPCKAETTAQIRSKAGETGQHRFDRRGEAA